MLLSVILKICDGIFAYGIPSELCRFNLHVCLVKIFILLDYPLERLKQQIAY